MLGHPVADASLRFGPAVRRHYRGTIALQDSGGAAESAGRSAGAACLRWRCRAGGRAEAGMGGGTRREVPQLRRVGARRSWAGSPATGGAR